MSKNVSDCNLSVPTILGLAPVRYSGGNVARRAVLNLGTGDLHPRRQTHRGCGDGRSIAASPIALWCKDILVALFSSETTTVECRQNAVEHFSLTAHRMTRKIFWCTRS